MPTECGERRNFTQKCQSIIARQLEKTSTGKAKFFRKAWAVCCGLERFDFVLTGEWLGHEISDKNGGYLMGNQGSSRDACFKETRQFEKLKEGFWNVGNC